MYYIPWFPMNFAVILPLPGGLALPSPRKEKNCRKCLWQDASPGHADMWSESRFCDPAFCRFYFLNSNTIGFRTAFSIFSLFFKNHISTCFHIFSHLFLRFFADSLMIFLAIYWLIPDNEGTWKKSPETGTFGRTCRRGWCMAMRQQVLIHFF